MLSIRYLNAVPRIQKDYLETYIFKRIILTIISWLPSLDIYISFFFYTIFCIFLYIQSSIIDFDHDPKTIVKRVTKIKYHIKFKQTRKIKKYNFLIQKLITYHLIFNYFILNGHVVFVFFNIWVYFMHNHFA